MSDNGIEINLKDYFRILVKKLWIVVLCAVIAGTAALVYTTNWVTPTYQASMTIYINNNSRTEGNSVSSGDLAVALRLVASYAELIKSEKVLDKVIEKNGLLLTANQLQSMIKAEPMGETEMLKVTVTTTKPEMSAKIANTIADVAPAEINGIIKGSTAEIVDRAKIPTAPSSPNHTTTCLLGAFAGAFLVMAVLLLQMIMDIRIKNEEDLTKLSAIPVLGVIPQLNTDSHIKDKKTRR